MIELDAAILQKCNDAAFCKRLRGQKGDTYAVQTESLAVDGSKLTASVENEANGAEFQLTLTAYNGIVRLHIDEDASKGRFEVMRSGANLAPSMVCKMQTIVRPGHSSATPK